MPALSELIGTASAPDSGASSAELNALKAELNALKASAAKQTDLTAATGRIKILEDKPGFDPKTIEDAIAQLEANEAIDDKTLEDLKKAFDALPVIDLSPYAKTADLKSYDDTQVKADLKALQDGAAKIAKDLADAIASTNSELKKRPPTVVMDHYPTDAETTGEWGLWQSQIPAPPDKAKINFFFWIGGQHSYQFLEHDIEIPWEALAVFDPVRQTYKIPIEGLSVEYNKTPIAVLGNQHFNPPALIFTFKDADTVFSAIAWKAQNSNGTEIGNGSGAARPGESLTVIQVNPAMAGVESTVITKVLFEFTRLNGTSFQYEVKI